MLINIINSSIFFVVNSIFKDNCELNLSIDNSAKILDIVLWVMTYLWLPGAQHIS